MNVLIYGAYGYSGKLIANEAKSQGLTPILAGRDKDKLKPLSQSLELDYRVFELTNIDEIASHLNNIHIVIHCAGPFSSTSKNMLEACILAKTHYTDITGEIDVFEYAHSDDVNCRAKKAGIVICPGVGFDIIPTDCIAARLKNEMPNATHLNLGFSSKSGLSPGTAKTSVESISGGVKIRKNGKIVKGTLVSKIIDFGDGEKQAVSISWGDVSTAYYSSGIPNIMVFIPASHKMIKKLKLLGKFKWLFKFKVIQNFLKRKIDKTILGPSEAQRDNTRTFVWGQATNNQGECKTARLSTNNGYTVTCHGALAVSSFLLTEHDRSGSLTPSMLMGDKLIENLAGSTKIKIT